MYIPITHYIVSAGKREGGAVLASVMTQIVYSAHEYTPLQFILGTPPQQCM